MFEDLQGIQEGRKTTVRDKIILERLIEKGEEIVNQYSTKKFQSYQVNFQTCQAIEQEVSQTIQTYNEQDLQGLVTALSNQNESENRQMARGMYVGALASVLTQRNIKENKPTKLHFDGAGNSFPHLLNYAPMLYEVVVENYKGDWILSYAGSHGGYVNNIILKNIVGNDTGCGIGSEKGHARNVVITGVEGDWTGWGIGLFESHVKKVVALHNKGDNYLMDCYANQIIRTTDVFSNPSEVESLLQKIKEPHAPIDEVLAAVERLSKVLEEVKV